MQQIYKKPQNFQNPAAFAVRIVYGLLLAIVTVIVDCSEETVALKFECVVYYC